MCSYASISLDMLPFIVENNFHTIASFRSVNFKFVPEPIFVSKAFAVSLLVAHLVLLATFAHYRWLK